MINDILYPMAYGPAGEVVDIGSAFRGIQYSCLGCNEPMSAVLQTKRAVHYRHRVAGYCNGETVLHKTAIKIIAEAFRYARKYGNFYVVGRVCGNKNHLGRWDRNNIMALNDGDPVQEIHEEARDLIAGVQPDLTITEGSGLVAVIEVVVTNSPSTETTAIYRDSGCPVILVYPSWESLPKLNKHVFGEGLFEERCGACQPPPLDNVGVYSLESMVPDCRSCPDCGNTLWLEGWDAHMEACIYSVVPRPNQPSDYDQLSPSDQAFVDWVLDTPEIDGWDSPTGGR